MTDAASPAPPTVTPPRGLAVFWIVAAVLGGAVSFLLYLEYIGQLSGGTPLVSCDVSPLVTCGPNLLSPGGNLLGFTNSLIGITLFFGPGYAAVSSYAAPGGLRAWFWRTYTLGTAAAFGLVHFFAWRSVFEYGSLCPWCMIVWLVTIPLFWFTLGWSLQAGVWGERVRGFGRGLSTWALLITILDYALIGVAAQLRLDVLGSLF